MIARHALIKTILYKYQTNVIFYKIWDPTFPLSFSSPLD